MNFNASFICFLAAAIPILIFMLLLLPPIASGRPTKRAPDRSNVTRKKRSGK
jgi:hypothetical protein